MKNLTLFIIVLLMCYQTQLFSQPCLPEGITFSTQAQIDNFQTNYPDCTEIEGDVIISGGGGNITNLNGINVLSSIGGNLQVFFNNSLTNLTGLENLTYVDGMLEIWSNSNLTSLSGLDGLTSIGQQLVIDNYSLTSLTGLESLTSIGWYLKIYSCNSLTNLNGLNGLVSVGSGINLTLNESLINLTGLESLTYVGGDFDIMYNYSLENLSGLENLTYVGGELDISYNQSINSLTALTNLTLIGATLWVTDNTVLTSIIGLENIDHNSITNLSILNNPNLNDCDVQSICNYLASPNGTVEIHDNALGCNSPEEVQEACDSITSIEELGYKDTFSISPNPCYSYVLLRFTISEQGLTICDIYQTSGIRIKRLLNEVKMPGTYEMEIDLRDLQKGAYFCVLKTKEGIQTKKMIKLD